MSSVDKFVVPDWGDKVDSGMGPARLHMLAGRYDNPMPDQLYPTVRDYEFGHRTVATLSLAEDAVTNRLDLIDC